MDVDPKDTKLVKVQEKLAKLLSMVKQERKVWKEMEALLAEKEAQLTTKNPPQAPAAPVKGPKFGAPNKFDGTCGAKAEVFTNQVNL
ncbi:uncharacterized protein PGTG_08128 [Puccinia graminis f. sp. tritici CRL 75-36-700-3]|uniref:Uncharacterized protein n=1 Tax=Puccinia graminis f. sp. tritici (strain CRL 75-36-700-3 / race SCCL) TaxID=418459 RepID=E3KCD1_PUCGT|nr:uncharacterized protein PGTG_08128 [Puccinia graminis f. sp. tritici CRL 75-36-700-3]EFP81879.2 hypothetical protein PGTG_08128 [Puccinia graminis f. sp. tritici CRL 75-36-700-3]